MNGRTGDPRIRALYTQRTITVRVDCCLDGAVILQTCVTREWLKNRLNDEVIVLGARGKVQISVLQRWRRIKVVFDATKTGFLAPIMVVSRSKLGCNGRAITVSLTMIVKSPLFPGLLLFAPEISGLIVNTSSSDYSGSYLSEVNSNVKRVER